MNRPRTASGFLAHRGFKMATTFTVTVNGSTFKRTSKGRTYTHAVLSRPIRANLLASANAKHARESDVSNFRYYSHIAAQQAGVPAAYTSNSGGRPWTTTFTHTQAQIDDAAAKVAGFTVETYCAKLLAERIARAEANPLAWGVHGWSGSEALAHKASAEPVRWGNEARVVPVGFVGSL